MTAGQAHPDELPTGVVHENDDIDRAAESAARRRERGIAAYARIFTVPEPEVAAALVGRVGRVFAEEAFLSAGGPAWSHPALTPRDRSIVVITALAAQGVSGDRLDAHLRLARRNGLDHAALTAMMTLLTIYLGRPPSPWSPSSEPWPQACSTTPKARPLSRSTRRPARTSWAWLGTASSSAAGPSG